MSFQDTTRSPSLLLASMRAALITSPVLMIFVSSNIANAGNLAYNILFSRWMGPELFGDLALVLTIKLSILSVLNAVQMAISKDVAANPHPDKLRSYGALSQAALLLGFFVLPTVAFLLWVLNAGVSLRMSEPGTLFLLCAALPFAAPLCFARGVATGQLSVRAIIASTQVEMLVRLLGGAVAWHLGYGIEGVTAAVAASIVAAWAVIARELPAGREAPLPSEMIGGLVMVSLPFALLQAAQVALLDGDVFIAKAVMSPQEAGFAAVLALFQRIEFFACFALASVLLPSITAAVGQGTNTLSAALPVAVLFIMVSVTILIAAFSFPEALMSILAGPEFAQAAPLLGQSAMTATAFTLSYLATTWLAALGIRTGIYLLAACVPIQFGALLAAHSFAGGLTLPLLVGVKLTIQLCLAALLTLTIVKSGALGRPRSV